MQRMVTTMLNELDKKNNQLQALMLQLALARSQKSAA
jgi:hypothetical protein